MVGTSVKVDVKMNAKGVGEMLRSSGVAAEMHDRAEQVLAEAQGNAPIASGAYHDSLHVVDTTTDRAVSRVVADVEYAWVVEANTGNLGRAIDAAR